MSVSVCLLLSSILELAVELLKCVKQRFRVSQMDFDAFVSPIDMTARWFDRWRISEDFCMALLVANNSSIRFHSSVYSSL